MVITSNKKMRTNKALDVKRVCQGVTPDSREAKI